MYDVLIRHLAMPPPFKLPSKLQLLLKSFDASNQHVVLTDKNGVIVYGNSAAAKHTGFSIDEMIGKKPGDLWGGHMPKDFYKDMWDTIAKQKQAFLAPMHNKRKNGEEYWQEVHILPVLTGKDDAEYFLGIELDLDDEQRREELLTMTAKKDQEYVVRWPSDWLFEAGRLSDTHLKQLNETYCTDGNCLESLVDDLITISSIHFAAKGKKEQLSPYKVLGNMLEQMGTDFKEKNYKLSGEELGEIVENRKLFEEFIRRFILNSSHYTHPVTGAVVITLLKTGNHCVIKCEDNGIGISAYEQKHMYDKFYRGTKARELYPQGSGLGLYIAKTIATTMGWELSHFSEKGEGAMFEVKIPIEKA